MADVYANVEALQKVKTYVDGADNTKEDKTNKVTEITSSSTDAQYPSAKAVYEAVSGVSPSWGNITGTLSNQTDLQDALDEKQDEITSSNKLDYSLISNTPTIPTVNDATISIKKNNTTVDSFTVNQSTNKEINITVPTTASDVSALPDSTTYVESVNGNSGVITGIATTATTTDLQTQITNLKAIGRFLALWNASTGVATSNPTSSPYTYKTGDYFRVSTSGTRIPTGTQYVTGGTNYTTGTAEEGDIFFYDGTTWNRQEGASGKVDDVQINDSTIVSGGVASLSVDGTYNASTNKIASMSSLPTKSSLGLSNVENKSSATIRGELTSSNVTTALGYTPYNSTNPNGYTSNTGTITGITMNGSSKGTSGVVDLGTVITAHQDISGKIDTAGTGLSKSGTTLNHSNSVTAQTTQALYPIEIDAQGHISAYGSAQTIPSAGTTATAVSSSSSGGSASTYSKSDHTHNIVVATGDSNGQVKIAGQNVSVKGLGSNAYTSTSYLPLTGGSMTGAISYTGTKSTYSMIKWIDNTSDTYGNGIRIGGGGATIIGGGESADLPSVSGGDEILYLLNDVNIDFYSNCQSGLSSAKHMIFDTSGNLTVPGNFIKSGGTSSQFLKADGSVDSSTYQPTSTAVTHTASTAAGSATQPVYVNSSGVATACTYSLNKTVPSDAVFTDTTYSAATTSAAGLMSASDKTKLDGIATGATNVTTSTVSGWGYTKNAGTVTSVAVKMNSAVKGTITSSGTIDLGTVLTSHQDISGKANAASITAGTAGTSSATSGSTLAVPYVTMNAQGIVTGYGTHTHTVTGFSTTDTKNTAGSTDTSSKIFLIGATTQAANPQTYSQDTAYVGTDGCLYSGGSKVVTDISGKANTTDVNNKIYLKSNTDNRSANTTPNAYNSQFQIAGLKTNSSIGLTATGVGTYSGVLGMRGWSDNSGGNSYEFALDGNGTGIYVRNGATTTWGSWQRIATTSDLGTQVTYSYSSGVLTITTK